jgi:hypothetical protein
MERVELGDEPLMALNTSSCFWVKLNFKFFGGMAKKSPLGMLMGQPFKMYPRIFEALW